MHANCCVTLSNLKQIMISIVSRTKMIFQDLKFDFPGGMADLYQAGMYKTLSLYTGRFKILFVLWQKGQNGQH